MKYTTDKIRKMFLEFFSKKNHKIIPSSSIIPKKNSNLLFTNAGMNQFQDIFLGKKKSNFSKVVTIQKCLRTGGKHNDLEQIGYSEYHNTFFEMLGNFSFGDYFKKKAIQYAWELLTKKKWFNLSKKKLFVTVYYNDKESYSIWKNIIGLSKNKIIKIGDKKNQKYNSDNFWQMSETGPCGPCTEIFYNKSNEKINFNNLEDKEKYIEIWNIVFIQFNRINKNKIITLPISSVDTGMGLERIASILQNVNSNYKTDEFKNLINEICKINNIKISTDQKIINVIADHIRAAVIIIEENILPENEHRGYVLRRIIRRALRYGIKLNIKTPFFYKLVTSTIFSLGKSGEYLKKKKKKIENILKIEEEQFVKTLKKGIKILESEIKKKKINSNFIFYLYDTFGFPIDLTQDICKEYKININYSKIKKIINKKKKESQKNRKKYSINIINTNTKSNFKGYNYNKIICRIKNIFINGKEECEILNDKKGTIILDRTPFYGESGGQIGDNGIIHNEKGIFEIQDTQNYSQSIHHIGKLKYGKLKINDLVKAEVNKKRRILIQNNHSATHLLHAILEKELKNKIKQKGSFINEKYLRFDFSYFKNIKKEKIFNVEKKINFIIQKNITIQAKYINIEYARFNQYSMLENKNYKSIVRALKIGKFSKELCKGTHAKRTGEIGLFKIIYKKSIAHGIHRIEAVTGKYALKKIINQEKNLEEISHLTKSHTLSLIPKIKKIIQNYEILKKENKTLNQILLLNEKKNLIKKIIKIKNIFFLNNTVKIKNRKLLKNIINQLKNEIKIGIIILNYQNEKQHIFIIGVTKNINHIIKANEIAELIKKKTKGFGGGKSEIAECMSKNINDICTIINYIKKWIISKI